MRETVSHARKLGIPEILIEAAILDHCIEELVEEHIQGLISDWRSTCESRSSALHCDDCGGSRIDSDGVCLDCQRIYEASVRDLAKQWNGRLSSHV
jgi:hypothetical protein